MDDFNASVQRSLSNAVTERRKLCAILNGLTTLPFGRSQPATPGYGSATANHNYAPSSTRLIVIDFTFVHTQLDQHSNTQSIRRKDGRLKPNVIDLGVVANSIFVDAEGLQGSRTHELLDGFLACFRQIPRTTTTELRNAQISTLYAILKPAAEAQQQAKARAAPGAQASSAANSISQEAAAAATSSSVPIAACAVEGTSLSHDAESSAQHAQAKPATSTSLTPVRVTKPRLPHTQMPTDIKRHLTAYKNKAEQFMEALYNVASPHCQIERYARPIEKTRLSYYSPYGNNDYDTYTEIVYAVLRPEKYVDLAKVVCDRDPGAVTPGLVSPLDEEIRGRGLVDAWYYQLLDGDVSKNVTKIDEHQPFTGKLKEAQAVFHKVLAQKRAAGAEERSKGV